MQLSRTTLKLLGLCGHWTLGCNHRCVDGQGTGHYTYRSLVLILYAIMNFILVKLKLNNYQNIYESNHCRRIKSVVVMNWNTDRWYKIYFVQHRHNKIHQIELYIAPNTIHKTTRQLLVTVQYIHWLLTSKDKTRKYS